MYGYIYKITCISNNKIYIGQHKSLQFDDRYYGSGTYIKRAVNKYGKDNFKIDIIEWVESLDDANNRETYYILKYNSIYPNGYNLRANGSVVGMSTETREKISRGHKGKTTWIKGKHHSKETCDKLKKKFAGKNSGVDNHFYGKKHTEETKKIIKQKRKNKTWWSNGNKTTLSEDCPGDGWIPGRVNMIGKPVWNQGLTFSEEYKQKLSDSHKGQKPKNINNKNSKWYNNGVIEKQLHECLEGWKEGRLRRNVKK